MTADLKAAAEDHFRPDYLTFYRHFLPDLRLGSNGQAMARCPFHDDRSPSLSIATTTGLYKCFGCNAAGDLFTFYARLNNLALPEDFPKVLAGIAADFSIRTDEKVKPRVVARYDYRDEAGRLVYQVERLEPKSFRIRQPEGNGWVYNAKGPKIIPYRLPEILKADETIVVEGEKDADRLAALRFTTTTNPFGAGKWPDHFGPLFAGKHVVLVPDNDEPGRDHMRKVAANLQGHAATIKWLSLPDLPEKGDVSDFLDRYEDKAEAAERLAVLIDGAPLYRDDDTSREDRRGFHFRSASDICTSPRPINWLIKPYVDSDALGVLFGEAGSMKSFMGVDFGLCTALGREWHDHAVQNPGPVFYIAGEGFAGIPRRIRAWADYHGADLSGVPFFVSDRPARFLDREGEEEVLRAVDELAAVHGNPVLVIVDTLNRNFGPGDENSTADMTRFILAMDTLRSRYRCAVLVIHHSGLAAADRARGASALRAALDWEYRLQKNADGTRTLTCTKAKDHGEPPALSFMPETIHLEGWTDEDGEAVTSCVLRLVDGVTTDTKPLTGSKKVAFDALVSIGEEYVHVEKWRAAAYAAGITASVSSEAKKKAFQRAVMDLRNGGFVDTKNDFWWPSNRDTGTYV